MSCHPDPANDPNDAYAVIRRLAGVTARPTPTRVGLEVMSDPASEVNKGVCWQCGAPADLDCAFTQVLTCWPCELKDGQGYPVVRGQLKDYVRVRVPRCEACCNRNWISAFLVIAGFLVGGGLGMGFSSGGWAAFVGGVVGLVLTSFGIRLYARLAAEVVHRLADLERGRSQLPSIRVSRQARSEQRHARTLRSSMIP